MLLLLAGLLAGAMNARAGGGSFVTLAALIAVGVPSVAANASSTIALYPAGLASAWVYRRGIGGVCGVPLPPTVIATLVGGLVGALLLLETLGTRCLTNRANRRDTRPIPTNPKLPIPLANWGPSTQKDKEFPNGLSALKRIREPPRRTGVGRL